MTMAKRRDRWADMTALEREIDRLVYALYGLTKDGIALIEDRPFPVIRINPAIKKT